MSKSLQGITFGNTHFSKPISESPGELVRVDSDFSSVQSIAKLSEAVGQYVCASIADSTRKAYRFDLVDFVGWGGAVPSSPEELARYIADRAKTLSPYTLARRLVAIGRAHSSQGLSDPTKADLVRTVLRGIRRMEGTSQRQVSPLLKQDLLAMLPLFTGTRGIRDRALILLGFSAALRRSELVALNVADISFVNAGLIVCVRKSKTDQEGIGRRIGVPWGRTAACPVKALQAWLEFARFTDGPVFRSVKKAGVIGDRLSDHAVAIVIKGYATAIGMQPESVSGHSLRAGLVTSASQAGISLNKIQQQTGHRSMEMVNRYIRDANLFENNAGGIL